LGKRRLPGEGSLFQRKDGLWVGSVELETYDGIRRQRRVTAKDRNTCIDKLKKLRREVDDGKLPISGKTTVENWLNRWLNEIHMTEIRPSTRTSYATTIRLYINPHIGSKRLDRLTPQHVREMLRKARETSTRAEQKSYIVLNRALEDAMLEGLLARNVAAVVHKPRHTPTQRDPLTAPQAKQLLRSAIGINDPYATRWAAALLLGARQGELLGLQWDHVNLDIGLIHLEKQLQAIGKEHGCDPPCGKLRCPQGFYDMPPGFKPEFLYGQLALTPLKSKAGDRLVPIPDPLWEMLLHIPRDGGKHNLVWHRENGEPLAPREDYDAWQNALKAAKLPPAPLHVARHTTASLLREAGVDEQTRMEILGHVSLSVTRDYSHPNLERRRESMASMNSLLELN
jgi:integrase